ncbi:peptidase M23-like protein [Tahibacter aquaticus]|uniref:Peptidase M23-like protein n=1 Tax=Tahibacter aquaticus TaxID=520092 RepID=A0A4V3DLM8_9GAMM|nr:peptidase M23-like protein [Tahibacter aquaticus]
MHNTDASPRDASASPGRPPRRRWRRVLGVIAAILLAGLLLPENPQIPVQGASYGDWNPQSFWYEPWGKSGVHKGIDIFAPKGRPVLSASYGVVIYRGELGLGGKVVAVLGPKWRIHYFAHLDSYNVVPLQVLDSGSTVGSVGVSGNAAGKPPHLHYAVLSLLPRPWRFSSATQGWKRMFFVDPGSQFKPASN